MYHTQENRGSILKSPIACIRDDAWLGAGYYFWIEERDSLKWGEDFKKSTGSFHVYKAEIDTENVLDTVFNEKHYNFWISSIEKAIKVLGPKSKRKLTLKDLNDYFKDKAKWNGVSGILFQDIPASETSSQILGFYYRKRIQLVVYNTEIINSFALHLEERV